MCTVHWSIPFDCDCGLIDQIMYFQLWYQYDTDGSGFIEADELKESIFFVDA